LNWYGTTSNDSQKKAPDVTTFASQQILTGTTGTQPGLVRRLAAGRGRATTARRSIMDRIIAELNRGA
jgi:hypothetical protein